MGTIRPEELQQLIDQLKASQEELIPFKEEAAEVPQVIGNAVREIERLVREGDLEAAEELTLRLWQSLGASRVIRAALSGSDRAYDIATTPPSEGGPSLQRTAEAVFFLQKIAKDIARSVSDRQEPGSGDRPSPDQRA